MAARALLPKEVRHVVAIDRRQAAGSTVLGASEQGDESKPGAELHSGRTRVVGARPVIAKYESKSSCLVYFGLWTPNALPRATRR